MNVNRTNTSIVATNDAVIAIGGYDGLKVLNSCELYNLVTEEWDLMGDLNQERSNASAVCIDNKIFIVGGINENG